MGIYYIITNLNWHFFHYSSTRGSSNQPSSQWYQSTFSTALQVMEWGVIPRPPIAVAKAKISRHWPASSGINPPWVAVDLFHPSSGVSYFPRSQAKDTEINKKDRPKKKNVTRTNLAFSQTLMAMSKCTSVNFTLLSSTKVWKSCIACGNVRQFGAIPGICTTVSSQWFWMVAFLWK